MSFENIPEELKQIPAWIVWKSEQTEDGRTTKIPYNPNTGFKASPTNPGNWGTFEQAIAAVNRADGLGFVLVDNYGYCCIDLDYTDDPEEQNLQLKIAEHFQSYSEISPSGKGLHIWIKAKLPSGRRRGKVEIYSDARYMTFTGNVYKNLPIADYQDDAFDLWSEMETKDVVISHKDEPQTHEDYEILEMAWKAVNGQKFVDLYEGRWQEYYDDDPSKVSCNEADFALVNIIAFYSQNREQIARIFRASALGKRQKAQRDKYVEYMLNRAFDNQPPTFDLSLLKENLEGQLSNQREQLSNQREQLYETEQQPSGVVNYEQPALAVNSGNPITPTCSYGSGLAPNSPYSIPPGLMGEIVKFIYDSSPRQVEEVSLSAAIGLMSGVCGRAYNISGTGLNTYTFLLAKTGRGKESMRRGITRLIGVASRTAVDAFKFMGPARIASAEALIKHISNNSHSFISILGEFADTLKKMSDNSRNPQQQAVRVTMLDLYNQSGKGDRLGEMIYSNKDNNTKGINAPAFSVIGESTPDKFYELLSKEMIGEGLLPRCTIIEYEGTRKHTNENHWKVEPSQYLCEQFSALCAYAIQLNNSNDVIKIEMSDVSATMHKEFDRWCDTAVNNGTDVAAELWTRAHVKALKIAGLLAVGCNPYNPVVTEEHSTWAIRLIKHEINALVNRFSDGNVGGENVQNDQIEDIKKAIRKYVLTDFEKLKNYTGVKPDLWAKRIIPHSFITAVCRSKISFKQDRLGPIPALRNCISHLLECNDLVELSAKNKREENLPANAKLYMIADLKL